MVYFFQKVVLFLLSKNFQLTRAECSSKNSYTDDNNVDDTYVFVNPVDVIDGEIRKEWFDRKKKQAQKFQTTQFKTVNATYLSNKNCVNFHFMHGSTSTYYAIKTKEINKEIADFYAKNLKFGASYTYHIMKGLDQTAAFKKALKQLMFSTVREQGHELYRNFTQNKKE